MRKWIDRRHTQGMTEYIVIVGMIAILLITAISTFRDAVNDSFDASTGQVDKLAEQISGGAKPKTTYGSGGGHAD